MDKVLCTACRVTLSSHEEARSHYKSEFHTYNLKRKHVGLDPLTQEKYSEKIEESKSLLQNFMKIFKCDCCNRVFQTEKQLQRHLKSNQDRSEEASVEVPPSKACLFCTSISEDLESNLKHMMITHGFFVPDLEFVKSLDELLAYLHKKVRELLLCLYCNSGHSFKSAASVQQHMRDKQHCFLGVDDENEFKEFYVAEHERSFEVISSEDEARLEHFVDLGSQSSETCSYSLLSSHHPIVDADVNKFGELRLHNGKIIGSKEFWKYYRQYYRPVPKRMQELIAIANERPFVRNEKEVEKRIECGENDRMLKQGIKNNMLQHHLRSQVN